MGWACQANRAVRARHVWGTLVATARACVIKGWGSQSARQVGRGQVWAALSVCRAEQHVFLSNREGDLKERIPT